MANYDFLRQISVKVNDGSGVIVKPCTDEYCYVFTDWHVIEHLKKEEISVEYYVSEKDDYDEDVWNFAKATPLEVYDDRKRDVAILKMPASMAVHFVKLREIEIGKNLHHTGFPENRRNVEAVECQWNNQHVKELLNKISYGFICYCFEKSQEFGDLAGTSGGGIFTDDGCLIGLHQGSSIKEKHDYYDKCNIIPIKFYKKVIENNAENFLPVWRYNWNSFEPFLKKAFFVQNVGEEFQQIMALLAAQLDALKRQCLNLSPKEIKGKLELDRIVNNKCFQNCFDDEDFGVSFLEYIVCMHLIYDFPLSTEGVCKMVNHSLFIYWQNHDDDVLSAVKNMDSSYFAGIKHGQNIYVGGLHSSGYACDVIKKGSKQILDISRPLVNVGNGVDVADALKIEYSYISTCLFTDCILQKIEEFKDLDENQVLKHYKEILEEKIS